MKGPAVSGGQKDGRPTPGDKTQGASRTIAGAAESGSSMKAAARAIVQTVQSSQAVTQGLAGAAAGANTAVGGSNGQNAAMHIGGASESAGDNGLEAGSVHQSDSASKSNVVGRKAGKVGGMKAGKGKGENRWSGDSPNLTWRAVPMDHLREHPLFVEL